MATSQSTLKAPFPYFGGKSRVASLVWERFGDVPNYIEPFFGSGAVLLARPHEPNIETVNDKDGLLANFWRALQHDPEQVAYYADWPVNEVDLHSRHKWLVERRTNVEELLSNPDVYDAKIAGWWVWGISQWIGDGWCPSDGHKAKKKPHLGNDGKGVHRKRLTQPMPHISDAGTEDTRASITDNKSLMMYFDTLSARLRRVRVVCGEWNRVLGSGGTTRLGVTGVFLDPPYADNEHSITYATGGEVFHSVRNWAIENGTNNMFRIAICGYEFDMPKGWTPVRWKAHGGYGSSGNGRGRENSKREIIWFSPHCLDLNALPLFSGMA